jgi:hypothetical protein
MTTFSIGLSRFLALKIFVELTLDNNLANLALSLSFPFPHDRNRGTPPSPLAIKLIKNCFKSGLLSFEYPRTILIYALPTSARSKTLTDFPQLVNQGVSSRATFANQEK